MGPCSPSGRGPAVRFRLFGTPIRIGLGFPITIVAVPFLLFGERGRDPRFLAAWLALVTVSVLVHEAGHVTALPRLRLPPRRFAQRVRRPDVDRGHRPPVSDSVDHRVARRAGGRDRVGHHDRGGARAHRRSRRAVVPVGVVDGEHRLEPDQPAADHAARWRPRGTGTVRGGVPQAWCRDRLAGVRHPHLRDRRVGAGRHRQRSLGGAGRRPHDRDQHPLLRDHGPPEEDPEHRDRPRGSSSTANCPPASPRSCPSRSRTTRR